MILVLCSLLIQPNLATYALTAPPALPFPSPPSKTRAKLETKEYSTHSSLQNDQPSNSQDQNDTDGKITMYGKDCFTEQERSIQLNNTQKQTMFKSLSTYVTKLARFNALKLINALNYQFHTSPNLDYLLSSSYLTYVDCYHRKTLGPTKSLHTLKNFVNDFEGITHPPCLALDIIITDQGKNCLILNPVPILHKNVTSSTCDDILAGILDNNNLTYPRVSLEAMFGDTEPLSLHPLYLHPHKGFQGACPSLACLSSGSGRFQVQQHRLRNLYLQLNSTLSELDQIFGTWHIKDLENDLSSCGLPSSRQILDIGVSIIDLNNCQLSKPLKRNKRNLGLNILNVENDAITKEDYRKINSNFRLIESNEERLHRIFNVNTLSNQLLFSLNQNLDKHLRTTETILQGLMISRMLDNNMMIKFDQVTATSDEIILDLKTLDSNIREMFRVINSHLSTTLYCNYHYCYHKGSTDYFANKNTVLQTSQVHSVYGADIIRVKCFINEDKLLPVFHNKKITWRKDGRFTYTDGEGNKLIKRECLQKISDCPDYLRDVTPLDLLKGLHLVAKGSRVYCQALKSIVVIDVQNRTVVCQLEPSQIFPPIFVPVLNFTISPSHLYSLSDITIPDHMSLDGLSSILIEGKDDRRAKTRTLFNLWSLSRSALSKLTTIPPHQYSAIVSSIITLAVVSMVTFFILCLKCCFCGSSCRICKRDKKIVIVQDGKLSATKSKLKMMTQKWTCRTCCTKSKDNISDNFSNIIKPDTKLSLADLRQTEEKISRQLLSEQPVSVATAPPLHHTDLAPTSQHTAIVHAAGHSST